MFHLTDIWHEYVFLYFHDPKIYLYLVVIYQLLTRLKHACLYHIFHLDAFLYEYSCFLKSLYQYTIIEEYHRHIESSYKVSVQISTYLLLLFIWNRIEYLHVSITNWIYLQTYVYLTILIFIWNAFQL